MSSRNQLKALIEQLIAAPTILSAIQAPTPIGPKDGCSRIVLCSSPLLHEVARTLCLSKFLSQSSRVRLAIWGGAVSKAPMVPHLEVYGPNQELIGAIPVALLTEAMAEAIVPELFRVIVLSGANSNGHPEQFENLGVA